MSIDQAKAPEAPNPRGFEAMSDETLFPWAQEVVARKLKDGTDEAHTLEEMGLPIKMYWLLAAQVSELPGHERTVTKPSRNIFDGRHIDEALGGLMDQGMGDFMAREIVGYAYDHRLSAADAVDPATGQAVPGISVKANGFELNMRDLAVGVLAQDAAQAEAGAAA